MAKKKAKAKLMITVGDGDVREVVREDGKYWYTKESQFRKAGGYQVEETKEAPTEDTAAHEGSDE